MKPYIESMVSLQQNWFLAVEGIPYQAPTISSKLSSMDQPRSICMSLGCDPGHWTPEIYGCFYKLGVPFGVSL